MKRDMHNLTSRCNCRRELRSFLLRYCSFVSCNEKITQDHKISLKQLLCSYAEDISILIVSQRIGSAAYT